MSLRQNQPTRPSLNQGHRSNTWVVTPAKPLTHVDQDLAPPACLSAEPHGPEAIRDPLQHYFGCIEISERRNFLDLEITAEDGSKIKNPIWEYEAELERQKLKAQVKTPDESGQPDGTEAARIAQEQKVASRVDKKIGSIAVAIDAQYERTLILREALRNAPDPGASAPSSASQATTAPPPEVKCGHLVLRVKESSKAWRESKPYKEGIRKVRTWKGIEEYRGWVEKFGPFRSACKKRVVDRNIPDSAMDPDHENIREVVKKYRNVQKLDSKVGDYDLLKDVNAYLIQYTRTKGAKSVNSFTADSFPPPMDSSVSARQSMQDDHFEPTDEELTDIRFKGRFPDQRLSMSLLLSNTQKSDSNILWKELYKDKDPKRIRYFHIPSNNMEWIEQVIAGYYGEKRPDLGSSHREPPVKTQTRMLLRPQFWRGQQNGARSGVVHARHMRPLCERISSEINEIEDNPKNIVLFMPYMHWETDRMRSSVARMIDVESQKQRVKTESYNLEKRKERKKIREKLDSGARKTTHGTEHPNQQIIDRLSRNEAPAKKDGIRIERSMSQLFKDVAIHIDTDRHGRLKLKNMNPLGQYLLDAARLYEGMSTWRDQNMLEKYLYHEPPLHPRRTLDQSYYWTLKTTKVRDRDQVVYRGTNMDLEFCHKLHKKEPEKKETLLSKWMRVRPATPSPDSPKSENEYQWTDHWSRTDEHGCDHCKNDIKKVSQLIMVDQLWMWVLDEQTIVTSFPRRYGYNKHDLSGIHKSIRTRLKSARNNQIRSVYDLALIILDECSNTFFDRTKTEDSQPQVMDIFSEAIGNVTNQHTISFQHVWHWTQKASHVYRSKSKFVDSSQLHVPLLDIHPEGKLQREVKDIIDELDIMIHIHRKQREVIRRFCKHVEHILDPEGQWKDGPWDQRHNEHMDLHRSNRFHNDPGREHDRATKKDQLSWFRMQSQELLSEVDDRVDELEGLRKGAESTATSVNDLLSLKQQQASVVQAWESVNQAEEAVRQGRSIMMFTTITIIFLPLSFMTSFFGMNNIEFGSSGTDWTIAEQTKLMFPISFGIVLISVIVTFSSLLRAGVWSVYTYVATWLMVKLGLYRVWLTFSDEWHAQRLMQKTEEEVRKMKDEIRKAKKIRRSERSLCKKDKDNENKEGEGTEIEVKDKRRNNPPIPFSIELNNNENGYPKPGTQRKRTANTVANGNGTGNHADTSSRGHPAPPNGQRPPSASSSQPVEERVSRVKMQPEHMV
ncbi:hypothetical protein B0T24DRAFT_299103 [Lasiosphaeria ovina]|uniref:Ankyrin repeat protein n=1 Tax=Lasiosphaeria ovina TaxID=92902 RepID=A0AAE0K6H1_9PEZI|nr:hypothetical protein B0T24DRAFT_299103 [Lasiosphaeria ovina]